MKTTIKDKMIVTHITGRIDINNAPEMEKELNRLLEENKGHGLSIDADKLQYISSAGLRVLLKIRKRLGRLSLINVSREVYEILEVTGFVDLLDVQKKLREVSVEGCEVIGRGGNGEVYRLDKETILKLYNESATLEKIALEKKYATAAFTQGLPCAISYDTVRSGNRYGIVFELIDAETVGKAVDQNPDRIPQLGKGMGELMRQLHATEMPEGILPKMSDKVAEWIDYLEENYLEHDDAELMRSIANAIPEKNTLLHCDFHEGNVMIQGEELLLIDLDDICTGNPIYDLAAHYTGHVFAARSTPEAIKYSMGMDSETALEMNRYTMQTYLGTEDPQVLETHNQAMQLMSLFFVILYLAKGKDSKNLTQERARGVIAQILPRLRQMAPMIIQVVGR